MNGWHLAWSYLSPKFLTASAISGYWEGNQECTDGCAIVREFGIKEALVVASLEIDGQVSRRPMGQPGALIRHGPGPSRMFPTKGLWKKLNGNCRALPFAAAGCAISFCWTLKCLGHSKLHLSAKKVRKMAHDKTEGRNGNGCCEVDWGRVSVTHQMPWHCLFVVCSPINQSSRKWMAERAKGFWHTFIEYKPVAKQWPTNNS